MSIVSSSFLSMTNPPKKLLSGLLRDCNRSSNSRSNATETPLSVRASAGAARPTSATVFIGGLISFGGTASWNIRLRVRPPGCSEISKAPAGADKKYSMKKLPKFIYDKEKALEKTRKILTEKIAQLSCAIDDASAQLHADDPSNGATVNLE